MRLSTRQLLFFAPLTVFIEWLGIFLDSLYWHPASGQPLSDVSLARWPAPLIFALTLTISGLTYAVFALSLRQYWRPVFKVALFSGVAFGFAGWIRYLSKTGLADSLHGLSILVALVGYQFIIWQIGAHAPESLAKVSQIFFWLINLSALVTAVNLANNRYHLDDFEFLTFILLQLWSLAAAWSVWRRPPPGENRGQSVR